MNKWLILFCAILSCSAASGQITVGYQMERGVMSSVTVTDAERGFPLGGAVVRFVLGPKDTVSLACNKFGTAFLERKITGDSIKIMVSYLGYEKIESTHKVPSSWIHVEARMKVDPLEISSIVVEGERIAMVVRGDTTIYNAGAFKTMRSDPMSELLKKLPGVEMREGNLYANGRRVQRILIDGTPLFGSFVDRAQELIRADNVEKVKVYDQHSEFDIMSGDTLKPKDRVLDVTTKKKTNIVQRINLGTIAGIYLDRNADDRYEALYGIDGEYDRHKVNNNLTVALGYGDKTVGVYCPSGSLTRDLGGSLRWTKSFKKQKYRFNSSTDFSDRRSTDISSSFDDYFPTEEYASRQQTNDSEKRARSFGFNSINGLVCRIDKRHSLAFNVDVHGNTNRTDDRVYNDLMMNDATTYLSDMRMRNDKTDWSVMGMATYTYRFEKPQRSLKLVGSYTYGNGWGDGLSVDTLASSSQKIFLTNTQNSRSRNYWGRIEYGEPLSKRMTLKFMYQINRRKSVSDRISLDRLTGMPDLNNTCDFTQNELTNSLRAGLLYSKGDKIYLNISLRAEIARQKRDETLPDELYDSRLYKNLLPDLTFTYGEWSSGKLQVFYNEKVLLPSVGQVRGALNTYKAPFYTAGNTALKQTVDRRFYVDYHLVRPNSASSWYFKEGLHFYQNSIVAKEIFFPAAAVRPEFGDFEFPAGATLRTWENASGQLSSETTIGYSTSSKRLRSSFNTMLAYNYDRKPYYVADELNTNDMHALSLHVEMTSDFSRKVEFTLSSITRLGHSESEDRSTLNDLSEIVGLRFRLNFAKRMWLIATGNYRFQNSTMPGTELQEVLLNAELACMFGKSDAGSISLNGNDLLNQARAFVVSMDNNRINVRRTTVLGRSLFVKFSYKF